QILEVYLNIAEFGPDLYGVADASAHYFGKSPDNINLAEGIFLASLLPNPKNRYQQFCRESLTRVYQSLLVDRLKTMEAINLIDHDTYVRSLNTSLQFNRLARLQSQ